MLMTAVNRGNGNVQATRAARDGKSGLFRSRLDQIINMSHELVRLTPEID